MRKIILSMQMSLDGFIEGPGGDMSWIVSSDDVWQEMFKDLQSVDTYMVGSNMYPGYAGHWRSVLTNPAADKNELKFARMADTTPHIVFSKSIKNTDWANTRIATDVEKEISSLKKQKGKDIMVWGGAAMASTLINQGWIDEYRITLDPVVLDGGKPLFNNIAGQKKLKLINSRPLSSGVVILNYRPE